jgi:hypothetical protein
MKRVGPEAGPGPNRESGETEKAEAHNAAASFKLAQFQRNSLS